MDDVCARVSRIEDQGATDRTSFVARFAVIEEKSADQQTQIDRIERQYASNQMEIWSAIAALEASFSSAQRSHGVVEERLPQQLTKLVSVAVKEQVDAAKQLIMEECKRREVDVSAMQASLEAITRKTEAESAARCDAERLVTDAIAQLNPERPQPNTMSQRSSSDDMAGAVLQVECKFDMLREHIERLQQRLDNSLAKTEGLTNVTNNRDLIYSLVDERMAAQRVIPCRDQSSALQKAQDGSAATVESKRACAEVADRLSTIGDASICSIAHAEGLVECLRIECKAFLEEERVRGSERAQALGRALGEEFERSTVTQAVAEARAEACSVIGAEIESWRQDVGAVHAQLENQTKRIMSLEQTAEQVMAGKPHASERPGSPSSQSTRTFESLEADGPHAERNSCFAGASSAPPGAAGEAPHQVQHLGEVVRQLEVKVSQLIAKADDQSEVPHALSLLRGDLDGLCVKFELMSDNLEALLQTVTNADGAPQDNSELRMGLEEVLKTIGFHSAALEHVQSQQDVLSRAFHEKLAHLIGKLDAKYAEDLSGGGSSAVRSASIPASRHPSGAVSLKLPIGHSAATGPTTWLHPSGAGSFTRPPAQGELTSACQPQQAVACPSSAQTTSPRPFGDGNGFPSPVLSPDDDIVNPLMQAIEALRDENLRLRQANLDIRMVGTSNAPEQQQQQQQHQRQQEPPEQRGEEMLQSGEASVDIVAMLPRSMSEVRWQQQQNQQQQQQPQRRHSGPHHFDFKQTQYQSPPLQHSVPEDGMLQLTSTTSSMNAVKQVSTAGYRRSLSPGTPGALQPTLTSVAVTRDHSMPASTGRPIGPAVPSAGGNAACDASHGRLSESGAVAALLAQQQAPSPVAMQRKAMLSPKPATRTSPAMFAQQIRGRESTTVRSLTRGPTGAFGGTSIDRSMRGPGL